MAPKIKSGVIDEDKKKAVFFKKISPSLKKFIKKYKPEVGKYRFDSPSWTLYFSHPDGGAMDVVVMMLNDLKGELRVSRKIIDLKKKEIRTKHDRKAFNIKEDVCSSMEKYLKKTVAWDMTDAEVKKIGLFDNRRELEQRKNILDSFPKIIF